MAGFVGIAGSLDARAVDSLSKAITLTKYSSKTHTRILSDEPNLKLAESYFPVLGTGRTQSHKAGVSLYLTGEIYSIAGHQIRDNEVYADVLLEGYLLSKVDSLLEKTNGVFNVIIYDSHQRTVTIVADRYGLKPLYIYQKGASLIFAGELKCFPQFSEFTLTINSSVVDAFIDLQHFMGNATWFEGVSIAAPSTIYTFSLSDFRFESRRYWSWSRIRRSTMKFEDAAAQMAELLHTVNNRLFQSEGRVGVALSGGLDSRCIVAAVHEQNPVTYTFGTSGSYDVLVAKQVAALAGVKHYHFDTFCNDWLEQRFAGVWKTDGMLNMLHMHYSHLMNRISDIMDINLSGFLGDAVIGGSYLERKGETVINRRIDAETAYRYYGMHYELCDWRDSFFDIEKIDPYLFYNRGRRMIGLGAEEPYKTTPQRLPFMDIELMDLSYSLPDEYRVHSRVYNKALLMRYPEFYKNIPHATTHVPIAEHPMLVHRIKRAYHRALWVLKYKLGMQTSYANVHNWIKEPARAQFLSDTLDPAKALYPTFTRNDYRKLYLIPHLRGTANYARQIMGALTFEIWLKQILEGKFIPPSANE